MRSIWLKSSTRLAVIALGTLDGTIAPASAHYTTTRRDGDECYIVRCDDDVDDCRTVTTYRPCNYNYRGGYGGRYWNGYGGGNGFSFYNNNDRQYDRYYGDYYGRYRHHERDDDDDD